MAHTVLMRIVFNQSIFRKIRNPLSQQAHPHMNCLHSSKHKNTQV